MPVSRKILLIVILAVAAAYCLRSMVIGLPYLLTEVTVKALGGRWEAETTRCFAGTIGSQTALYRHRGGHRELVEPFVNREIYVGDDCVIYSASSDLSGDLCSIICSDRPRVVLVEHDCYDWQIREGRFETTDYAGKIDSQELEILKLKARAAQPGQEGTPPFNALQPASRSNRP